ncbi:MAG: acetyl-CoA hydrolase/transferase C-terminal domain-containing protein [Woeseiaceae bacterium]
MSRILNSAEAVADAVIDTVGKDIVLGLPVGIGKATHVADALFERAAADASIALTIFTGLTLEPPRGGDALERRFTGPLVARLYRDWPTPRYAVALRERTLPANIRVHEFYLRPGAFLGNPLVQQSYASINYSQVTGELLRLGVNVIAQLVAVRPESPQRYSLSSNPEITLDLLPALEEQRRQGKAIAMIGQVNRNLPYMTGEAELAEDRFELILDDEAYDFPLFTLPNRRVSPADYATGMHVASLVRDGGTLQLGIGSLSDAVAHCLRLRHEQPEVFARALAAVPGGTGSPRRAQLPVESSRFEDGLFGSTELLGDALFSLFEAGIVKRPADADDKAVIHAGFFIGSGNLYAGLNALSEDRRDTIKMSRISKVNTLFGDEHRKRRQRRLATFANETMMATLLGTAVSDALEDGRVVSGVGGQFDFVAMASVLKDARSVLMCRARRDHRGVATSNILWSYAHATVPRHYRDVFVSEYGIADTRGKPDSEVIGAMVNIADSEFQQGLIEAARRAGKLGADFIPDADARDNTPQAVNSVFRHEDLREHFPPYPLGTEFTQTEQALIDAFGWLESRTATPLSKWRTVLEALLHGGADGDRKALARLDLERPRGVTDRVTRKLIAYGLERTRQ